MKKPENDKEISQIRKIASFLVSLIFIPRLFIKRKFPLSIKNILLIQWDYLGDIILTTPAMKELRCIYPKAEITLLTNYENKEYINRCPFVDNIIYLENVLHVGKNNFSAMKLLRSVIYLRKIKYNLIIEFTGRLPNQIYLPFLRGEYFIGQDPTRNFYFLDKRITSAGDHQIDRNLDVVMACVKTPNFAAGSVLWNPARDEDRIKINELLASMGIRSRYVIMHVFGAWGPKAWPIERWVEVADYFLDKEESVIFIGSKNDREKIDRLQGLLKNKNTYNLAGTISIPEAVALMEKARLFIGNDSGPMHLAALSNLRGIVLFGSGNVKRWAHALHTTIYKEPVCGPCPQIASRETCIRRFRTCIGLLQISSQDVINACEILLFDKNLADKSR